MMKSNNSDTQTNFGYNYCEFCGAPIPKSSTEPICAKCYDRVLFLQVKDYIRANDVNEFQVASYFNIPLRMVKGWIKEGRIEYKLSPDGKRMINTKTGCESCERCGSPVTFGSLCPKCLKLLNKNMHGYDLQKISKDDERMFYFNNDWKK